MDRRYLLLVLVLFCCGLATIVVGAFSEPPQRVTLEDKVKTLQESLMKKPAMNLNLDKWRTFVQSSPRNYSMVVMFTVLSQKMNCPICKPAHEEFLILANSYRYAYLHSKSLYFAIVDYEEAPQIFQQLNLNTAPAIYHFPAKGARRNQDNMDFQRMGIDADAMAKFVLDRTEIHIRVLRPPNYAAPIVVLLLIMLVLGLLYMRRNNLEFLGNRTFWGIVCLCIVLAFMSGQMWNHIRGPPFVMTNPQTRETSFIHGSTQFQLIAETYIVLIMYAAVSAGIIILNDAAQAKTDPGKRRLLSCVGLGLVVVFFSLLLSIFRSKYQGLSLNSWPGMLFALLLLFGMSLGYALRFKREILQSSTYWGIVCLCVSFTLLSGQMWNRIKNPPFEITYLRTYYVYQGSKFQLGAETYFVFLLYAAISVGVILVNAAEIKKNLAKSRKFSLIGIGMLVMFLSLLISVFRLKEGSYPFRLFFA